MSWYNRRPKVREPQRAVPRETSPLTERLLEESKNAIRKKTSKPKKI
jgi:hypothetical protein